MRIHMTAAETGDPWSLPSERFARQFAECWPDGLIDVDTENAHAQQVRFELTFGEEQAEGLYLIGDWQQLICWDGTIDAWAQVIEWFLTLLPLEAAANIFLEAVAIPQRLPRLATATVIARILTELDESE